MVTHFEYQEEATRILILINLKLQKTWGEHLRESDNKKLQDKMNKQDDRRARKNEKKQFQKDVKDYREAKNISTLRLISMEICVTYEIADMKC